MCEFLSGAIGTKTGKISSDKLYLYFGDKLDSHSGIEDKHGLKAGQYREWEWTRDSDDSLVVRVEDGESANYYRAIILGDYKNRKNLLKKLVQGKIDGVTINERLKAACAGNDVKAVDSCVKAGADITAGDNCAVKLASENGHLDVVKYLVSKGADITAGDNCAVRWASKNGHLDVVKYLVSKGADITAGDNYAVRWASKNGHLDVVKYLVSKGADITAGDNCAVKLASIYGHLEVIKYLESVLAKKKKK